MKLKQIQQKTSVHEVLEESDDEWVQLNEKYTHIYKLTPHLLKWKAPDVPRCEILDQFSDNFYDEHADESDEEWVAKNCPDKNKHSAQALCCAACFITIAYQSQIVLRHKKSIYFTTHDIVNCHVQVKDNSLLFNDSKRLKCSTEILHTSPEKQEKDFSQIQPIVLCNNCASIIGYFNTEKQLYILQQAILSPE